MGRSLLLRFMSGLINLEPTKCPYCPEDIEDDDDYNEHLVLMHPAEIDDLNGGEIE